MNRSPEISCILRFCRWFLNRQWKLIPRHYRIKCWTERFHKSRASLKINLSKNPNYKWHIWPIRSDSSSRDRKILSGYTCIFELFQIVFFFPNHLNSGMKFVYLITILLFPLVDIRSNNDLSTLFSELSTLLRVWWDNIYINSVSVSYCISISIQ